MICVYFWCVCRSTIEETYARSMTKLAKTAGNFSQLGWAETLLQFYKVVIIIKWIGCSNCSRVVVCPRTFAPVWEVFKGSTERLASCHMELVRKLQELIKDVQKYVEEQAKAHKKVGTWSLFHSLPAKRPVGADTSAPLPVYPHPQLTCHGSSNRTESKNRASSLWSHVDAFTKTKRAVPPFLIAFLPVLWVLATLQMQHML